eukprot:TRINITY_DN88388_c0_g1_i1.p1 TRINITY_DN88388_c0_g1~~TRINITY_DN88388_c0_g1_i1.p1  ORF type:complete len:1327 (-),score=132.42 TRINITY_DN88388_c0_g1_i1:797-4777(-)
MKTTENPKPVHTISNKFTAEKLMTMLDKEKLGALEEQFEIHPDGLEAKTFVWLMKNAMNYKPEEKYELLHGLHKLFAEIDINGDCKMQWSEFTQYVIDAVMQDNFKVGEEAVEAKTQKEIVEEAHSKKFVRYTESACEDRNLHEGLISKAIFINTLQRILFIESRSSSIKFFSTDLKKKETVDLYGKDIDLNPVTPRNEEKYTVLSAAYNEKDQLLGCVCGNKTLQVFSLIGNRFKRSLIKRTAGVQYSIWYIPEHQLWVTASKDPELIIKGDRLNLSDTDCMLTNAKHLWTLNYINIWAYTATGPRLTARNTILAHNSQIMDCIELLNPLVIVTCSLDRAIRAWDPLSGSKLGSFYPKHSTGVRALDYISDFPGYIVSIGHENIIKLWSPEVSIKQAYVGTLEGHNAAVISAKFIPKTPLVVSIDERLTIRVWDIKLLNCLQAIALEKKRFECNGLLVIPGQRKFAIYGRRFILFEKTAEKKRRGNVEDEQYPLHVEFNEYYKTFIMVTKMDIRVYEGNTGQLINIFPNILQSKGVDITSFCLGERHRKFYIGDINGSVRVYNASNGVLLKTIGEHEDVDTTKKHKAPSSGFSKLFNKAINDHHGEISGLHFVKQDNLLISTSFDSTINVYDEEYPEIAPRLRQLSGGHLGAAVTCLSYSPHLGLIATGCANGAITVWDYEMSRVEAMCHLHTREIIHLEFLEECPVLVSTAGDGYIFVWGVRGSKQRFSCLCGLLNAFMPDEESQFALPVRSMTSFVGVQKAIPKKLPVNGEDMEMEMLKERYRKIIDIWKPTTDQKQGEFLDLKERQFSKENLNEKFRTYIVTGDEKGRVRTWDFTYLLETLGIRPLKESYRSQRTYFNPKRKGLVDVSSQAQAALMYTRAGPGPWVIAEKNLLLSDFRAHKDLVCSIKRIESPKGFVTASYDRHFKVWSRNGDLWGNINTAGDDPVVYWKFPLDWSEERKKDKAKIIELIKEIEPNDNVEEDQLNFETYDSNPEHYFTQPSKNEAKKRQRKIELRRVVDPPLRLEVARKVLKKPTLKEPQFSKKPALEKSSQSPKKKPELEQNDPRLAKDVIALLDTYKDSPQEKKFSIYRSLESLKDRLQRDGNELISQYALPNEQTFEEKSASPTMLPLYFARDPKPLDMQTVVSKYAVSSASKTGGTQRKLTSRLTPKNSSVHSTRSRISTTLRGDKRGILKGLKRIDVVGTARKKMATGIVMTTRSGDIRQTPREVGRQFDKSIISLSMKKFAEIKNYNPVDNSVLQQEMDMMKTFSFLPKLGPKRSSSKYLSQSYTLLPISNTALLCNQQQIVNAIIICFGLFSLAR